MKLSQKIFSTAILSVSTLIVLSLIINKTILINEQEPPEINSTELSNIDEIYLVGNLDVRIKKTSDKSSLKLSYPSKYILNHFDIYVDGKKLYLKQKRRLSNSKKGLALKAKIQIPQLRKITVSGHSNTIIDDFNGEKLVVKASGNALLKTTNSHYEKLYASGSGFVQLRFKKLTATNISARLTDSAKVYALINGGTLSGKLEKQSQLNYFGHHYSNKIQVLDKSTLNYKGEL